MIGVCCFSTDAYKFDWLFGELVASGSDFIDSIVTTDEVRATGVEEYGEILTID